jgi:hypothetical protein
MCLFSEYLVLCSVMAMTSSGRNCHRTVSCGELQASDNGRQELVGTGPTGMAVSRRRSLDHGLIAAAAMTVPAGGKPDGMAGREIGDIFVTAADPQGPPIQCGAIRTGAAPILAWPRDPETGLTRSGTRLNQMLLLNPGDANGWQGQIQAFSAICPHAACLCAVWP